MRLWTPHLWIPRTFLGTEMGFGCCPEGCEVFDGTTPSSITVVVSGETDIYCPCSEYNGTYELDYTAGGGSSGDTCSVEYQKTSGQQVTAQFAVDLANSKRRITVGMYHNNNCGVYGYSMSYWLGSDSGWESGTAPFEIGTTYNLTYINSLPGRCGETGQAAVTP